MCLSGWKAPLCSSDDKLDLFFDVRFGVQRQGYFSLEVKIFEIVTILDLTFEAHLGQAPGVPCCLVEVRLRFLLGNGKQNNTPG